MVCVDFQVEGREGERREGKEGEKEEKKEEGEEEAKEEEGEWGKQACRQGSLKGRFSSCDVPTRILTKICFIVSNQYQTKSNFGCSLSTSSS